MKHKLFVIVGVLLCFTALALGAQSQKETFFSDGSDQSGVTGNLMPFFGFFIAIGTVMATYGWTESKDWKGLSSIGGAVWGMIIVGASAYQNYTVDVESRFASIQISNLASNEPMAPTTLVPILVAWLLLLLLLYQGIYRCYGHPSTLDGLWRQMLARALLQVPLLAAMIGGNIYVLAKADLTDPTLSPLIVLVPMISVGAATLMVCHQLRLWHFGLALEDPRLAAHTIAPWRNITIAEFVAAALVILGCIGGIALPKGLEWDSITQAKSFLVSARTFLVLQGLAVIPLYIWMRAEQRASRVILRGEYAPQPSKVVWLRASSLLAGWAALVCIGGVWIMPRGIWVLILASTPIAIFALTHRGSQGALLGFLCGALWWSAGNSLAAIHSPNDVILLSFDVESGLQAIVRFIGIAFLATSLFRVLENLNENQNGGLALAASFGIGLTLWIEASLSIWIIDAGFLDQVGVGSFIQSQQPGFKFFFQVIALGSMAGAALAWSAMRRPEWFKEKHGS